MDISHISAGRANATSRAIGHPGSREQEMSGGTAPGASRELFTPSSLLQRLLVLPINIFWTPSNFPIGCPVGGHLI